MIAPEAEIGLLQRLALRDYYTLCKPKVVAVMLVTSFVGMLLASHPPIPWQAIFFGTIGISFAAASAAVINHLIDASIDAKMSRTAQRPIASGRISRKNALYFAAFLGLCGLSILIVFVNKLTAILSFATIIGYAIVYTLFLKRATPQNIVIGGAAGAMPPLLGWAAISNEISAHALLLVLIIFAWTPPHFWALAIYRREDYQKANIPMLPVTHGIPFTTLCIVLYTVLLIAISILPYLTGMSGKIYLFASLSLGLIFLIQSIRLHRYTRFCPPIHSIENNTSATNATNFNNKNYTSLKLAALKTFSFSIIYLLLLFTALLVDHYMLY